MQFARVLVVDDGQGGGNLVSRVLSTAGYEVRSARDHKQAQDLIRAEPAFDLIVVHAAVLGTAGQRVPSWLRRLPRPAAVLLLSDVAPCRLPLATAFLRKPFDSRDLMAAAADILARAAQAGNDRVLRCNLTGELRAVAGRTTISAPMDGVEKCAATVIGGRCRRRTTSPQGRRVGRQHRELFDALLAAVALGNYDEAQRLMEHLLG